MRIIRRGCCGYRGHFQYKFILVLSLCDYFFCTGRVQESCIFHLSATLHPRQRFCQQLRVHLANVKGHLFCLLLSVLYSAPFPCPSVCIPAQMMVDLRETHSLGLSSSDASIDWRSLDWAEHVGLILFISVTEFKISPPYCMYHLFLLHICICCMHHHPHQDLHFPEPCLVSHSVPYHLQDNVVVQSSPSSFSSSCPSLVSLFLLIIDSPCCSENSAACVLVGAHLHRQEYSPKGSPLSSSLSE